MPVLRAYEHVQVRQRNLKSGDVPAAVEWLLKYERAPLATDWHDFQERVDLCTPVSNPNSFLTVPTKIEEEYGYPRGNFRCEDILSAEWKCQRIKDLIDAGKACLLALRNDADLGYQTMPVVEYDGDRVVVLDLEQEVGRQKKTYAWQEIKDRHRAHPGGHDLLWIEPVEAR